MPTVEDQEQLCESCKTNVRDPQDIAKVKLPTKTMRASLEVWVCPHCDGAEAILEMLHYDKK